MYLTEKDAWQAAIQQANLIGRSGNVVEYIDVLPPMTPATGYVIVIGQIRPPKVGE